MRYLSKVIVVVDLLSPSHRERLYVDLHTLPIQCPRCLHQKYHLQCVLQSMCSFLALKVLQERPGPFRTVRNCLFPIQRVEGMDVASGEEQVVD